MSFITLAEAYRQLRTRLMVYAGPEACQEVAVSPPLRDDDELSFVRLVVWGYVLVQESARVPLRFLMELPPFATTDMPPELTYLRTWSTHNLLADKDGDAKKLKLAWAWLRRACGTDRPEAPEHWRACFDRYSATLEPILKSALDACKALATEDDGPRLVEEMRLRIDRNWEAFRFDQVVAQACDRLGYVGVDIVKFRKKHLDKWRNVVSLAEDGAEHRLLAMRVEADLLDLLGGALGVLARERVSQVPLGGPKELAVLLLAVRSRAEKGGESLERLLDGVAEELGKAASTGIANGEPTPPGDVAAGSESGSSR